MQCPRWSHSDCHGGAAYNTVGSRVLVIGYGRVGRLLAHRLKGLGARVTVSARSFRDLAWIEAYGYCAEHTGSAGGLAVQL